MHSPGCAPPPAPPPLKKLTPAPALLLRPVFTLWTLLSSVSCLARSLHGHVSSPSPDLMGMGQQGRGPGHFGFLVWKPQQAQRRAAVDQHAVNSVPLGSPGA